MYNFVLLMSILWLQVRYVRDKRYGTKCNTSMTETAIILLHRTGNTCNDKIDKQMDNLSVYDMVVRYCRPVFNASSDNQTEAK